MAVLLLSVPRTDYIIGNKIMRHTRHLTSNKKQAGFTLAELIVGLVVFYLAIAIAINLFSAALRSQRKSVAIQNVQDNARYLMGFIAKEIRMSEIETADGETLVLNLVHPVNGNVQYVFSGNQIFRADDETSGPINSDEVQVNGRFFIDGKTADDNQQPRVTIILEVKTISTKPEEQAKINLQTTLTQRNIE